LTGNTFKIGQNNSTNRFTGDVANFRFFSNALNAEQVKELYAYDAVRFGHRASNSVSVHKGNLGVGVAAPTSRFEVAPADGVFEYPPQAMTDFETYMEGHGVFRVSASSQFGGYNPHEIFDKNNPVGGNTGAGAGWASQGPSTETDTYNATTGLEALSTTHHTNSAQGEWVQFETPHPIKLKTLDIHSRSETNYTDNMTGFPKNVYLYGSNDIANWSLVKIFTTVSKTLGTSHLETIDATEAYKHYAFVVNSIHVSGTDVGWTSIGQLYFHGTPAPSTLDDGHLTLGKQLTTPRVSGHAAGAETPRAESLVVHYDTTLDGVVARSGVVDTSGSGNNGTVKGGAAYSSSDRSFKFDGTGDYIVKTSASGLPTGDAIFSMSAWIKIQPVASWPSSAQWPNIISYGSAWAGAKIGAFFVDTNLALRGTVGSASAATASGVIIPGTWQHVVAVKSGTGQISTTTYELYVDGVKLPTPNISGTYTLNIDSGVSVSIGGGFTGVATDMFTGSIAKPKVWNVALTADEVAAEYALGRTGKAISVTDTAVCIGGVAPRAQLDVRGSARFDGYIETNGLLFTQAEYSNTFNNTSSAGAAYEAIPIGTLTNNATYFVTLRWGPSASPFTPWEAKATTFLNVISTNTSHDHGADWIALNTATHDANNGDYTIYVKTKGGSQSRSGLSYKVANTYAPGNWTIEAYRIV
jgi:hypothetical protein